MKRKILFLALIPLITSCNSNNQSHSSSTNEIENKFADAIDLGTLTVEHNYDVTNAFAMKTNYFKFTLDCSIVFDVDEYGALQIYAADSPETYEYFSMSFDFNLYDSNFNAIETITYRECLIKYYSDMWSQVPEEVSDSFGIGARVCDFDINPGVYYFSLTPTQEVCNNTYKLNISDYLGD